MSFYDSTMSLYRNQYAMFGDPEVLPVKVIWDYTYYWGVLCQLFFQRRLTDLTMLSRLRDELNGSKDAEFRDAGFPAGRGRPAAGAAIAAVLLDQARLDWFAELNRGLRDPLDDAGFKARIRATTLQLRQLAREIVATATRRAPGSRRGTGPGTARRRRPTCRPPACCSTRPPDRARRCRTRRCCCNWC